MVRNTEKAACISYALVKTNTYNNALHQLYITFGPKNRINA
jgi:hypothetical protein